MKCNIPISKKDILPVIPWFFLFSMMFALSMVIVFTVIPRSLAARTTMEVYQQEGHKAFGQATSLDIWGDPELGGQNLVHPSTKNSYVFAVYNNSNSEPLPYSLELLTTNPGHIPLVFSFQKNGAYLYGGEDKENMIPLCEIKFPEASLGGQKTDLYILRWEWKTESDDIDTAIGNDGTQIYKLTIKATGTTPEINDLPPVTGDHANMLVWLIIMLASMFILLILLFCKRKEDEDDQTFHENI